MTVITCRFASGSSPPVRGALAYLPGRTDHRGLIPARAGNTPVADFQIFKAWAHPRSRGEHGLLSVG